MDQGLGRAEGAQGAVGGDGIKPNKGELSEGADGTFGRFTLFNTATYQQLLDCNQSKARDVKKKWEGRTMQGAGKAPHAIVLLPQQRAA